MKILPAFVFILAAFLAVPAAYSQDTQQSQGIDPNFLIIPEKSFGKWSLDWTIAQFRQGLGPESSSAVYDTASVEKNVRDPITITVERHHWTRLLTVWTRPDFDNKVIGIGISATPQNPEMDALGRKFRTAEGIGLYSTIQEVFQKYGGPYLSRRIGNINRIWYANGLSFDFLLFDPVPYNQVARIQILVMSGWK